MTLTIGHLYPEALDLYGDRGNVECLVERCRWRGIQVTVKKLTLDDFPDRAVSDCDLIFAGGGPDVAQKQVARDLQRHQGVLHEFAESGGVACLFVGPTNCWVTTTVRQGSDLKGIGIFDLHTQHFGKSKQRCIGNVVVKLTAMSGELSNDTLVGFENHGGRTYLGKSAQPLGKVIKGCGNNGEDKTEGAIYKNFLGTYLHGPLLPKNRHLADWFIKQALERRHGDVGLEPLDDSLEERAHQAALKLR